MKKIHVRENNGRCLLRFTNEGISYSLTLGSYSDERERLKAERLALEISESIYMGEFEDLTPWKPRRIEISRNGIIEELRNRLTEKGDKHLSSVLANLEKYHKEIRNKTEAKRFFEWLPVATATKRRYYTAIRTIEEFKPIFDFEIKGKKAEKKKQIDPFTTEEIGRIKKVFIGHHYETFVLFLLHTGCRPSESIGIRWKDIEFDNNRIHFHQSLSRSQEDPNVRVRKETKTGKNRFTPLGEELREILLDHQTKMEPFSASDLLFLNPEGTEIDDDSFRKAPWIPLLKRCGVRYRSPYNLRHTFISHCLRKGVDVVTVAYWVGNSPEVIYKHYAGMIDAVPLPKLF